ncbi:hypothetical protein DHEL01_v204496 [Diaporthe helianthi]|uniref:PD-(D/E)XK nuclease-like domain-containing protein n=1 Tax=Diaporthe helianthi TaxID=158607 RepID=A0A2P5I3P2_DIAHE|nr:hypothetical protein DHEL01_v204496 [Diaporthe helianthi]
MQPSVTQNTRLWIQSWLESLEEDTSSEPQAKRARCQEPSDDHLTYTTQYNTARPQTPPLTAGISLASSPAQSPRHRARKRGLDDIESADVDDGKVRHNKLDKTPQGEPLQPFFTPRKRSQSPQKSRAILNDLLKHVRVHAISNYAFAVANLPSDILPLYESIVAADEREKIIPWEVREQVAAIERCHDSYFCEPRAGGAEAASATFKKLCDIQRLGEECQTYQRHESAWNHLVRTPLLNLVFTSTFIDPFTRGDAKGSLSSASFMPSDSSAERAPSLSNMKSSGVKVDYVLAL